MSGQASVKVMADRYAVTLNGSPIGHVYRVVRTLRTWHRGGNVGKGYTEAVLWTIPGEDFDTRQEAVNELARRAGVQSEAQNA